MNILYEDNHVIVVNKVAGELVQPDPSGGRALENDLKSYIKVKYNKAGNVFLGVVHRIDRPVSGAVLFAKTSKALVRLNEQLRERGFKKTYWAIVENCPDNPQDTLTHHLTRNHKINKAVAHLSPTKESQEAILNYKLLKSSDHYHLLEIELVTGRHHQIRCQLAAIGSPIKGDLKYGAARSNKDGSIALHSRSLEFIHPVTLEKIVVKAPVPAEDPLWAYFAIQSK